jgi:hypothetical protein
MQKHREEYSKGLRCHNKPNAKRRNMGRPCGPETKLAIQPECRLPITAGVAGE